MIMNKKIRQLESALMDLINTATLPPEVVRMILGKLEAQITNISNLQILQETEAEKDAKGVQ